MFRAMRNCFGAKYPRMHVRVESYTKQACKYPSKGRKLREDATSQGRSTPQYTPTSLRHGMETCLSEKVGPKAYHEDLESRAGQTVLGMSTQEAILSAYP